MAQSSLATAASIVVSAMFGRSDSESDDLNVVQYAHQLARTECHGKGCRSAFIRSEFDLNQAKHFSSFPELPCDTKMVDALAQGFFQGPHVPICVEVHEEEMQFDCDAIKKQVLLSAQTFVPDIEVTGEDGKRVFRSHFFSSAGRNYPNPFHEEAGRPPKRQFVFVVKSNPRPPPKLLVHASWTY